MAISIDHFGPTPVKLLGNTYILLVTDRFNSRADMFAVAAAEFTTEGTTGVLTTRTFPFEDAATSRTTASSSAQDFHTLFASYLASVKSPPARTAPTKLAAWSVQIPQWRNAGCGGGQ